MTAVVDLGSRGALTAASDRSYNPGITGSRRRAMASETGKRYACSGCGSEFVVTRVGDGTISCCGRPTTKKT